MASVLYVKANPKLGDSWSLKISNFLVEEYQKLNPQDEIIELDLYKSDIPFLFSNTKMDSKSCVKSENFKSFMDEASVNFVEDFIKCDKYIISTPMWNFSAPAILKAWIDQICVPQKTFKYDAEKGLIPLLTNKKVVSIIAMGGKQYGTNYDFLTPYLRHIFTCFLGIKDYRDFVIESTNQSTHEDLERRYGNTQSEITSALRSF